MPKLNAIHLPKHKREQIAKMERGEEVGAKKDRMLLNEVQQQLKKAHKPPKTQIERNTIGWREIREVR